MKNVSDLALMIDSNVALIVIETHDENQTLELLTHVAIKKHLPSFRWSITEGLQPLVVSERVEKKDAESPLELLATIKRARQRPALFVLCDFHPFVENAPEVVRLLKDIALNYQGSKQTVVLVSHEFVIPAELQHYAVRFQLNLLTEAQLMAVVREEVSDWSKDNAGLRIKTEPQAVNKLIQHLKGLNRHDAKRLARVAIRDDGAITHSDLTAINQAKFQLMDIGGVLSYEFTTEKFLSVGGFSRLKEWLTQRQSFFLNSDASAIDKPKGLMLIGVQGGGKSLAAKAIAGVWGVPLLRFDMAALYNKFIGETEKSLYKSLQQAEQMAPCVLWIDEIEKGIANDSSDEGTSRRILGMLLTWMAERSAPVFLVATCNDVSQLPPELLRKGRIDELFFVDLPTPIVREDIFQIHLNKRNFDSERFDLALLAEASEGFSGAEIEQAIVSAIYGASAQRAALSTAHIIEQLNATYPLSVVMAEKMAWLREWARGRTVNAD